MYRPEKRKKEQRARNSSREDNVRAKKERERKKPEEREDIDLYDGRPEKTNRDPGEGKKKPAGIGTRQKKKRGRTPETTGKKKQGDLLVKGEVMEAYRTGQRTPG